MSTLRRSLLASVIVLWAMAFSMAAAAAAAFSPAGVVGASSERKASPKEGILSAHHMMTRLTHLRGDCCSMAWSRVIRVSSEQVSGG